MRFDILTIFPQAFESYFNLSILKRAQEKGLIKIFCHNLRQWTENRHQKVDDRPYGGGAGMIFKVEPIYKAIQFLKKVKIGKKKKIKRKVILFSASGKKFTQKIAQSLSRLDQLIFICPRYEGIDERVAKYIADEEISIGDYILTGGELPAMVVIDAVARLIPRVIKKESLEEESFCFPPLSWQKEKQKEKKGEPDVHFGGGNTQFFRVGMKTAKRTCLKGDTSSLQGGVVHFYEYPQYTRPEIFFAGRKKWRVPKVLLTGNHQKIADWRIKHLKKPKR